MGCLFKQAEEVSKVDAEEFIAYWFVFATATQQLISAYTFERDPVSVTGMVSQAFKLCGIIDVGLPTRERPPQFPEIFCYFVAGGFYCFPSIFAAIPLLRSYDPIGILLKDVVPPNFDLPRKILTSICYFIITFLVVTSMSSYILLAMSTTHAFETLTKRLLTMTYSRKYTRGEHDESALWKRFIIKIAEKLVNVLQPLIVWLKSGNRIVTPIIDSNSKSRCQSNQIVYKADFAFSLALKQNNAHPNQCTDIMIMNDYTPQAIWNDSTLRIKTPKYSSIKKFRQVHYLHSQVRMLITLSNKSVEAFVPVMNAVGISFCTLLSVAIIKILHVIPTLVATEALYAFFGIVIFGIIVAVMLYLITFFFKHASEPRLYSTKYIHYWRNQPLPSLRRKQARAMSEIAFNIGPFCKATKNGALLEMQKISDFIITLFLGFD
ncbi:unnamed protein product [Orchesella dallaii]|uniref:Odorant receptor n=1 Tax=Orchesella dallaii TaxID=48710 RepID=A0ABP1Q903_9HEXA